MAAVGIPGEVHGGPQPAAAIPHMYVFMELKEEISRSLQAGVPYGLQ